MTPLVFDCPRCGATDVAADFYGPCPSCIAALRSADFAVATAAVAEYAPKMNVTPNFVATKD